MHSILYHIVIYLNIVSLIIGYFIGRYYQNGVSHTNTSFFSKLKDEKIINSAIYIDDKKFVTDINTNGLERKYDSLGDIKKTDDNISNSVNKLKNLKR